ncbi:MAG TPA: cytochrome D1 domain-containing protein [Gemmatimonadaceae bacterium]|nr:cytochrome D1 domain-containing protein [Gemmatimonadaceae bacterium]
MARTLLRSLSFAAALPLFAGAQQPALIVLNKAEATASVISLADGATLHTLPVGDGPHEVAVSPDGRWAVVANYGTGPAPGSSLTVLDLRTRKTERTIDLGEYRRPHGIAFLPGAMRVLVTSEANQALVIVDVTAGRVERVIKTNQAGTHLFALSADGARAWTSNIGAGTNSLVDLQKGEVVRTAATGRGPEALDVSPDGRELWVGDSQLDRVIVLDANSLDSLATIPAGGRPNRLRFTRDGRWVFESNIRTNDVYVYDARERRLVAKLAFTAAPLRAGAQPQGAAPEGILLAPDGTRVWIALSGIDRVAEVDIGTRTVLRYFETGRAPDGMAYAALPRP